MSDVREFIVNNHYFRTCEQFCCDFPLTLVQYRHMCLHVWHYVHIFLRHPAKISKIMSVTVVEHAFGDLKTCLTNLTHLFNPYCNCLWSTRKMITCFQGISYLRIEVCYRIASMHGIYSTAHVGKYTVRPMDDMGPKWMNGNPQRTVTMEPT